MNKLFWDPKEKIANYDLTFIHRGALMDMKVIHGIMIKEVESFGFVYKSEKEGEIFIPFHRILEIRNIKTGQILWKKIER